MITMVASCTRESAGSDFIGSRLRNALAGTVVSSGLLSPTMLSWCALLRFKACYSPVGYCIDSLKVVAKYMLG